MTNFIKEKIKILSLFSGIGAFEKALTNLNIDYELVNYCEIDKFASKSYSLIHNINENKNLGDIRNINIEKLPSNINLITHGSPCQDFSIAGNKNGGDKGSGTRSALIWNSVEIIKHCKPKYIIWENVKSVLFKKHKHNFDKYLQELEKVGYTNYYKILNAKDFGIPQNRERIFVVSILNGPDFTFPEPTNKIKNINDFLEDINIKEYNVVQPSMVKHINGRLRVIEKYCWTITLKQVRLPNAGVLKNNYGYRYLTPLECFRLMGFKDEDYYICKENNLSNNQLYKQAGNSIVVPVLEEIFKNLLE